MDPDMTMIAIGIDRIGTELDIPAMVPICQIGGSRIGMPCIPRDKTGRFISSRSLVAIGNSVEASALPSEAVTPPAPVRRRVSPIVKLLAILCALAACGAWLISTALALSLLRVSGPFATAALLHIAQFTPGEFQPVTRHPYVSAVSSHRRG